MLAASLFPAIFLFKNQWKDTCFPVNLRFQLARKVYIEL